MLVFGSKRFTFASRIVAIPSDAVNTNTYLNITGVFRLQVNVEHSSHPETRNLQLYFFPPNVVGQHDNIRIANLQ